MNIPIALIGGLLIIVALVAVVAIVFVLMRADGGSQSAKRRPAAPDVQPRQANHPSQKSPGRPAKQQTSIYTDRKAPPPNPGQTAIYTDREAPPPNPGETAIDPFRVDVEDADEDQDVAAVQTDIDSYLQDDRETDRPPHDESPLADTQIDAPSREDMMRRLQASQADTMSQSDFGYVFLTSTFYALDEGETVIGSDPACDLTLPSDPDIAEQHLRIFAVIQDNKPMVFAEPLHNANDILHNRQPLTKRTQLQSDDMLDLSPQTTIIYTHQKQGA